MSNAAARRSGKYLTLKRGESRIKIAANWKASALTGWQNRNHGRYYIQTHMQIPLEQIIITNFFRSVGINFSSQISIKKPLTVGADLRVRSIVAPT
jgi:hypothetical protein